MTKRRKMYKKAYVKTLEAAIALVMSFLFITYFIPVTSETDQRQPNLDLVNILEQNPDFRRCTLIENYSCLNATFEDYYPNVVDVYNYRFNISTNPRISGAELPTASVYAESLMIAGNDTYIQPKTVRLYYWLK